VATVRPYSWHDREGGTRENHEEIQMTFLIFTSKSNEFKLTCVTVKLTHSYCLLKSVLHIIYTAKYINRYGLVS
jgi:hypothetical protein